MVLNALLDSVKGSFILLSTNRVSGGKEGWRRGNTVALPQDVP